MTFNKDDRTVAGTQTLVNGINVLRAVASGSRSLATIHEVVDLPRSTVHRLITSLRRQGFLRDSDVGLTLGPDLITLGFAAVAANPLLEVSRSTLKTLSNLVLDTVLLAVEDNGSVLYMAKISGQRGAEMRSQVGQRMPMTRTGIGKALLLDAPQRWREMYKSETPIVESARSKVGVEKFLQEM